MVTVTMFHRATLHTPNRQGFALKFSRHLLALVTNEEWGLQGSGTLHILTPDTQGALQEPHTHQHANALFDVSWLSEQHLATGSGDGSVQIWALHGPIHLIRAHALEVSSVDCKGASLVSASWDASLKLWDCNTGHCLRSLQGHSEMVHEARFSPNGPHVVASVSTDKKLLIWSLTQPMGPAVVIRSHDADVLCCDWSRMSPNLVATGGSDGLVRCWDLRNPRQPLSQLRSSPHAVKKVRFAPHFSHVVAAASLEPAVTVWDCRRGQTGALEAIRHHSHYIYGLDWHEAQLGLLADCSWDSQMEVFHSKSLQRVQSVI